MASGLLLLRLVLGLTMAGHGAQKLFGWRGGPGLRGVYGWLSSMRFRGGWLRWECSSWRSSAVGSRSRSGS